MHLKRILAAVLVAIAAGPAAAEQLKGSRFIEVMQDNTLSGTTADGAAYNLYFLPGGEATYDDATGARDRGRWSMDADGDVCVSFEKVDAGPKGLVLSFRGNEFADPLKLVAFIKSQGPAARVRPNMQVVFFDEWETPIQRLKGTAAVLRSLAGIAEQAKAA